MLGAAKYRIEGQCIDECLAEHQKRRQGIFHQIQQLACAGPISAQRGDFLDKTVLIRDALLRRLNFPVDLL